MQREVVLRPPVLGAIPSTVSPSPLRQGRRARAERLAELRAFTDGLGFDGVQAVETLEDYNAAMTGWPEAIRPARVMNARPLSEPPSMHSSPARDHLHVRRPVHRRPSQGIDPAGVPVPGLFAAGADAGNVFRAGYAGGLALAGTFGFRAAMQMEAA